MSTTKEPARCTPPSASTFSFTAPFSPASALKQRRVSLALPSSPRLVPAWSFRDDSGLDSHVAETSGAMSEKKGSKMRKITADDSERDEPATSALEKKQRKKWTEEETQMLVDGCNSWGVGNWKAILKDPKLKFDNRSPVDLKDRFRTYFPDAYRQHYPNAKTHLSSRVRSTLPDGTSIFEKTRSKKRRPFTAEEDQALKAGYERHGTVWATIVKDPIFMEQNRRSTDLRDRFRNAFPELYQAAGYKPRNTPKKKKREVEPAKRAATDDQLAMSSNSAGPVRRRRAHTTQGWYRGGTKSVPESTTCSEDESSGDEEEQQAIPKSRRPGASGTIPQAEESSLSDAPAEADMDAIEPLSEPLSIPDYIGSSQSLSEMTDSSQSQAWSSAMDARPWSAGSPTSSHMSSDYLLNQSPYHRRSDGMNMIGKSAWGTQDWFSPNPRLDPSGLSSGSSSYASGGISPAPSSPFSFHNLNHGVLDRYDLFPSSFPHDFASEVGAGDSHSTFSDPEMFPSSNFSGFTHHSNYAGDLIFGARSHQPQPSSYGSGFGFGTPGLGLTGVPQSTGVHPMQLHTSSLPGIDEIELGAINLNDQVDAPHDAMEGTTSTGIQKNSSERPMGIADLNHFNLSSHSLGLLDLPDDFHTTPPATPVTTSRSLQRTSSHMHHMASTHGRSISVPPSEHRAGPSRPPQTHATSQPLPQSVPPFSPTSFPQQQVDVEQFSPSPIPQQTPYGQDIQRPPNDLYDLPFLDLHYYSSNHSALNLAAMNDTASKDDTDSSRRGQALDLAQAASSMKPVGVHHPLSLGQHITQSFASAAGKLHLSHHRGQSAISPKDLLLRKGSDNKRKRSSWDGGAS
ncbi:hypothetical protein PLICRDRAFT_118381 [Plicaturopsis crispa FD-325 SS-3]|uniref:Myb-like domain-containing protein n=1 Tax=Plicaturopsis crispa FD-325 SS-3 TaxID=944288 RepID=A0A0C9SX50_PLICR|nr:hypothetical protein PLICRDRAFT_118381 [Plicaturopsis crispa FD-325 SS-3]